MKKIMFLFIYWDSQDFVKIMLTCVVDIKNQANILFLNRLKSPMTPIAISLIFFNNRANNPALANIFPATNPPTV